MGQELFLVSNPRQLPFGFVSNSHTLLPQLRRIKLKGTDVGMRKRVDEERGREHREVTKARNFKLHCNAALTPVPSDKWQAAQDSNHSCCQIGTPSETELIAWTNLQSNDAICCSMPWEGLSRQISEVYGENRRRPCWEVVVFLEGLVCG